MIRRERVQEAGKAGRGREQRAEREDAGTEDRRPLQSLWQSGIAPEAEQEIFGAGVGEDQKRSHNISGQGKRGACEGTQGGGGGGSSGPQLATGCPNPRGEHPPHTHVLRGGCRPKSAAGVTVAVTSPRRGGRAARGGGKVQAYQLQTGM